MTEKFLERLRDNLDRELNEAQIKMAVILPILRALDWDDTNLDEFVPEYSVRLPDGTHGSVDYALFCEEPGGIMSPMVFIEAKRQGKVTVSGVEQVFTYAANRGVPFLILTDGNIWNFYLSMAAGIPAQRRFHRIELKGDDRLADHAQFLGRYLRKGRVGLSETRLDAEALLRNDQQRRVAREAIPAVWRSLLESPGESLTGLITDAVACRCGFSPALDDVTTFLKERAPSPSPPIGVAKPPGPVAIDPPPPPSGPAEPRIRGFVLDGESTVTKSAKQTLIEIIERFQRLDGMFMERFALRTSGRTRRLVATTRDQLYDKREFDKYSEELNNGWWIGTNLNQALVRRHIVTACDVKGIRFGSRLTLIER